MPNKLTALREQMAEAVRMEAQGQRRPPSDERRARLLLAALDCVAALEAHRDVVLSDGACPKCDAIAVALARFAAEMEKQ